MVMGSTTGVDMPASGGGGGAGGEGDQHNSNSPAAASECRRLAPRRRRHRHRHLPGGEEDQDDVTRASVAGGGEKRARQQHGAPPPSPASASEEEGYSDHGGEEDGPTAPAASANAAVVVPAANANAAAAPPQVAEVVWPVAFGSVSLAGRLRVMEDTVSVYPSLCVWSDGSPMHLFAVFDGHGGSHVAALCRDQMHVVLAAELAVERQKQAAAAAGGEEDEERAWGSALSRSFARVDAMAAAMDGVVLASCACGHAALPCTCPLSSRTVGTIVGSTAIVALLVRDRLVVANCGDSRAVLCRAAAAVPLSSDQKPDRPDEKSRIESVGGRVVYINGPRVRGILAMSRAIGHRYLKPEVICDPEISITVRTEEDDCLILASDGLWDVISNQTACSVARQCLEDGNQTTGSTSDGAAAAGSGEATPGNSSGNPVVAAVAGQQSEPRCFRAAALLARLALGRESSDNISVIVIDLKARG